MCTAYKITLPSCYTVEETRDNRKSDTETVTHIATNINCCQKQKAHAEVDIFTRHMTNNVDVTTNTTQ